MTFELAKPKLLSAQQLKIAIEHEIFDGLPMGVFTKDKNGIYTYGNSNLVDSLGKRSTKKFKKHHLIGLQDEDLPCDGNIDDWSMHDKRTLKGKSYFQLDIAHTAGRKIVHLLNYKQNPADSLDTDHAIVGYALHFSSDLFNLAQSGILKYLDQSQHYCIVPDSEYQLNEPINYISMLTKKEKQILFYVVHGLSAKRIANIQVRSLRTIQNHIYNIKEKWKCSSISELSTIAEDIGLVNTIPLDIFNNEMLNRV